jgi:hypothetical protein
MVFEFKANMLRNRGGGGGEADAVFVEWLARKLQEARERDGRAQDVALVKSLAVAKQRERADAEWAQWAAAHDEAESARRYV